MYETIPARPRTLTEERKQDIAAKLADKLIKHCGMNFDERDEIINDIVKYGRMDTDGYQLAKELDDRCFWSCNMDIVEILDEWHWNAALELNAMELEWAKFWDVQPKLKNGTRITLPKGEVGTIDGIYEYGAAKYLVKIDRETTRRSHRIIAFEDAKPIE